MDPWTRFVRDRRGGAIGRVAMLAGVVALMSVAGARFMDAASRDGSLQSFAFWRPAKAPGIDYTATGSIRSKASAVLIDPCTGKPK